MLVPDSGGSKAGYLEQRYDDRPTLFGCDTGQAHARFVNAWTDQVMHPAIARLVVRDVLDVLDPKDRSYFRKSREERFGMTLEEAQAGREERLPAFRASLAPLRTTLVDQDWFGGKEGPSYADYIVFGAFMWARCTSRFELLAADDLLASWRLRMLNLFGGLARNAPAAS